MSAWNMHPAIARPAPTPIAAMVLGRRDWKMYSSVVSRSCPPFCIADMSEVMASLMGIIPPEEIAIEMRNITTQMNIPTRRMMENLLLLMEISLLSSSSGTMSSLIPLYPFLRVEKRPLSGPLPLGPAPCGAVVSPAVPNWELSPEFSSSFIRSLPFFQRLYAITARASTIATITIVMIQEGCASPCDSYSMFSVPARSLPDVSEMT